MKKVKKVLALAGCAALLVVGSVAGTIAYLTAQDEVVNTFSVGKVNLTLDEAKVDEDGNGKRLAKDGTVFVEGSGQELHKRVQNNKYKLMPGSSYYKDPTVHITKGSEECYVRMFVTITHSNEWDKICKEYKKTDGSNKFGAEDMFTDLDTEHWEYKGNKKNTEDAIANTRTYEFWYRKKVTNIPTDNDKSLEPLFKGIQMPEELTNEDLALLADKPDTPEDESFKIYIVAQAIQAEGFGEDPDEIETSKNDAFAAAPEISGTDLTPEITGSDSTTTESQ